MTDSRIYIKEVQGHQHRYQKLIQLTHSSTKAAGAMLLAAVVALIVANTAAHEPFLEFWHSHVGFFFGESVVEMSLAHVINDVFMAVFFLLVGLEMCIRDRCMFEVDLRSYARRRRVDPQVGDEVLIVGQQGDAMVTIEEMCETLNTIPHELCIGFAQRMPRYYV